ncbi:MAG: prolipoprotein diacylglyceryl transferase [Patescibacteria group bacterium]
MHTFHPSPILFSFGPFSVHWYGLFMLAGVAAGYAIARRTFAWARVSPSVLDRLVTALILGGFIGARLYHVLNVFGYYWSHPLDVFAVWKGGLAIHGALLGGLIALWWFVGKRTHPVPICRDIPLKRGFRTVESPPTEGWPQAGVGGARERLCTCLLITDLLAPSVALGQAIGRWGNYFRQELYGLPTDLPWGIPIDAAHRLSDFTQYKYFHPVFLYESVWLIIVCIILLVILSGVMRSRTESKDLRRMPVGRIFFLYLILAGLGRFFIEFLRIDPMPLVYGVRLQQLVSIILIMVGFGGIVWMRHLARGGEDN